MAKTKTVPKKGSKVIVKEEGVEYLGTVTSVIDGVYSVMFEDGDEGEYDIKDIKLVPAKEKQPKPPVLSKEEAEKRADIARKKAVDAANKAMAAEAAKAEAELANTPLNDEEKAFIARIRPMMNKGRPVDQPSSAEITRYARLVKREKV